MNILMMTNTYAPFIGGVERSIATFATHFRRTGHRVVIVAPTFEHMPTSETDVIRVPAVQHFNGTDFSVHLPIPGMLHTALEGFEPDVVHSHHPYLLGDTALRMATHYGVPLIFTFHTFYEQYTHYVPGDSAALKRFVVSLSTGYANLCDCVLAPSRTVAEVLAARRVVVPIHVCPTGIDVHAFEHGDGARVRRRAGIPRNAYVVGTVSRLAPEKNIPFLAESVCRFLDDHSDAWFLVVGTGPSESTIRETAQRFSVGERVRMLGPLAGSELIDAYHAFDVFAFASQSETQGLVIAEAMAARLPVVALSAPVVAEMVADRANGCLVAHHEPLRFAAALHWLSIQGKARRIALGEAAWHAVRALDTAQCAARVEEVYREAVFEGASSRTLHDSAWDMARRRIAAELHLFGNLASATVKALRTHDRLHLRGSSGSV